MNEVVHDEGDSDGERESEKQKQDEGGYPGPWDEDDEETDEDEEKWPEDLVHARTEAEAFLTEANRQRAEVEKARGFFKKSAADPRSHTDRQDQETEGKDAARGVRSFGTLEGCSGMSQT